MQQREIIEVSVNGNWLIKGKIEEKNLKFIFYAEPNIVEKNAIKNEAAELLGGREKIVDLERQAFDYFEKHLDYNKKKYGDELLSAKLAELDSFDDTQTNAAIEHYNKLYNDIYKNRYYDMYAGLMEDRVRMGEYAFLKVMSKEKPEGFEFFQQKEEELKKIVKEVEIKKKFFRSQANESKTIGATQQ